MTLGKLFWRLLPIAVIVWGTRTGAIQWGKYFQLLKNGPKVVSTMTQMGVISRALVSNYQAEEQLIGESDFTSWLRQNFQAKGQNPDKDAFDEFYVLEHIYDGFQVRSSGPDHLLRTDDDIVQRFEGLSKVL